MDDIEETYFVAAGEHYGTLPGICFGKYAERNADPVVTGRLRDAQFFDTRAEAEDLTRDLKQTQVGALVKWWVMRVDARAVEIVD